MRLRRCFSGIDVLLSLRTPLLALKGLAMLEHYADAGLRPMSDVDLLVHKGSAVSAVDALLGAGWTLKYGKQRSDLANIIARRHGFTLQNDAEIDIHWSSLAEDNSERGDEGMWSRARPMRFWGRELLVPCPEDLVLHTCVHGARFTRSPSVAWVPDTAAIIQKCGTTFDWTLLVGEARRRVVELPVRETLRFLREELSVPIPREVLDALAPRDPAWLFWLDHHLYAADPASATTWHRTAGRIVANLRRGVPLPGSLVPPSVRSTRVARS